MVTSPERQIGALLTSDEDFRMQLEGHAVIHPSCNTLKNICACSKMFATSKGWADHIQINKKNSSYLRCLLLK
ncbi:hypothetical protein CY35_12G079900 [Sphagnum magellanicum]|nr:hypothetical protein CY35_12G079900 [Sphagnum magellanicum]